MFWLEDLSFRMRLIQGGEHSEAGCYPITMIGLPTQDATGLAGSKAPIFRCIHYVFAFTVLAVFAFLFAALSIGARKRPV